MKQYTIYADEKEQHDFERVKRVFGRRSSADTIRAMIHFCLQKLDQESDTHTAPSTTDTLSLNTSPNRQDSDPGAGYETPAASTPPDGAGK